MALYLWYAKYESEGVKGLIAEGGSKRRAAVQQMVEKAGGKLHSFYYAFGDADVYGVTEFPDQMSAIAVSLAVNASGLTTLRTIPLFTAEDMDGAAKKTVAYRAPGR